MAEKKPSHAASDHGSVEDVERGEESGRAVALVVMGHRPAFSGLERQARLRAVERLDLALLVGGRKGTDGLSHAHRLAHPAASGNHPTASAH